MLVILSIWLPSPARAGSTLSLASNPVFGGPRPRQLPPSFLGISTEYWSLPLFAPERPLFERALRLFTNPGDGPLWLRIGGQSADRSFLATGPHPRGRWVFRVTRQWLALTRRLVLDLDARVLLDLNLVTADPRQSAAVGLAVRRALPPARLGAVEIGNEPDIYDQGFWIRIVGSAPEAVRLLPPRLSLGIYLRRFAADADALRLGLDPPASPAPPIAGPAIAAPLRHAGWINRLLGTGVAAPEIATLHWYPYSACYAPGTPGGAAIRRLLGSPAPEWSVRSLARAAAQAHRRWRPLWVTEMNSVACGGRAGVSDTFATALWAPGALFALLQAGVDEAFLHLRARTINAPFIAWPGQLEARPLLYGLALFARATAGGGSLLPVLLSPAPRGLLAWAMRRDDGSLRLLLLNQGPQAQAVTLNLPLEGALSVQRLSAPAVGARRGVRLNGQWIGRDGRWAGGSQHETLGARAGVRRIMLRPYSAALLRGRMAPQGPEL